MGSIAREYAEALFMLAKENQSEELYGNQLDIFADALKNNPDYAEFLSSPAIPVSERTAAVEAAFKKEFCEDVLCFIELLAEKGRIPCFFECLKEYVALLECMKNQTIAVVTSAVPLTKDQIVLLTEKLSKKTGKNVVIEQKINPALLGGITVEIDGNIIDGSLKNKISELKGVICK